MVTEEAQTIEYEIFGDRADVGLGVNVPVEGDHLLAWLNQQLLTRKLLSSMYGSWFTEKRIADIPADMLVGASSNSGFGHAVVVVRGLFALVRIDSGDSCHAWVYGAKYAAGEFQGVLEQLRSWLPVKVERDPERVQIGFVHRGGYGRRNIGRSIAAPKWAEIRENYPAGVAEQLDRLFTGFNPGVGGRLLLLHGTPGTGKTYVVRALAREWQAWCTTEYVTDPEAFVGNAEYMMQTVLEAEGEKWRLLILEDAGELLARDAKQREGQGLSRLLNLSEGLIGQGLQVLILITTNEKLQALNEAVARPGRTAVDIEFLEFTVDEANTWLAEQGRADLEVSAPATLAELFAMLSGERITAQPKRGQMGFLKG